jgi:hypothetical protein
MTGMAGSRRPGSFARGGGDEDERISDVLDRFRRGLPDARVTLALVLDALADRSAGTILLILAIPTVSPIPLGVSMLFNLPLLLYCASRVLRPENAGLPGWLSRRSIERARAERILTAVIPRIRWIERFLRPRWHALATIDGSRRFRLLCLVLAVTAFVPLPLMGWLPGFAMVFLALGLIERDGGVVALGLVTAVAAFAVAALIVGGMAYAGVELYEVGTPP